MFNLMDYNYLIDLYSIIWIITFLTFIFIVNRSKKNISILAWAILQLIIFGTSFTHQVIVNVDCQDEVCKFVKHFLIVDFNGQGTLLLRLLGITTNFIFIMSLYKKSYKKLKDERKII